MRSKNVGQCRAIRYNISNYTIAKYCSDKNDVESGIYEIKQIISEYEKINHKVPSFLYYRFHKLILKLNSC